MFWVIQMLSLTELAAGSSVSTLTAFAITSVSLFAPSAAVRRRAAAAAAAGGERNRHQGGEQSTSARTPGRSGLVVDMSAWSAMADPFVAFGQRDAFAGKMYEWTENILMLPGYTVRRRAVDTNPSRDEGPSV